MGGEDSLGFRREGEKIRFSFRRKNSSHFISPIFLLFSESWSHLFQTGEIKYFKQHRNRGQAAPQLPESSCRSCTSMEAAHCIVDGVERRRQIDCYPQIEPSKSCCFSPRRKSSAASGLSHRMRGGWELVAFHQVDRAKPLSPKWLDGSVRIER